VSVDPLPSARAVVPEARRRWFVRRLLAWGRANRRDFPWRHENDPFRVLVGEVLLQRSRSTTVARVYARLFDRWPTPKSLSLAPLAEVADTIRPLGLTSRAGTLLQIARQVDLSGMPRTEARLRQLPGVGQYAARATLSASGRRAPLVDGVSARVYRRFFAGNGSDVDVWALAEEVAPHRGGPEWNWAVLDLAASLCLPLRPRCQDCPLRTGCDGAAV
jgi:A/G-specific adenine glycosylase